MTIADHRVRCYMPEKDGLIIESALSGKWRGVHVPFGKLDKVAPHVYSVECIAMETATRVTVALKETFVKPGWEDLLRIGVVREGPARKEKPRYGSRERTLDEYPPMSEIGDCPDDLNIRAFLNAENFIETVRFRTLREDSLHDAEELTEAGLVASNDEARMLLYPDDQHHLNLCITTDEGTIEAVTEGHGIVPLMLGP